MKTLCASERSRNFGIRCSVSTASNSVPPFRRERGLVLFVVAIVLVILCLGGTTLFVYMRTESDAAAVRTLELQLENAARSAVALMQGIIEAEPEMQKSYGGIYSNPALFAFQPVLTQAEGARDEIRFTILAPEFRVNSIDGVRYGLVNESTRLNLAAVLRWERERPGMGREALMKLPGMTTIQADSILDWTDPDDQTRAQGAENRWYEEQRLPYSTRGTVPVFLEELLLVRNVTRLQLYSDDEAMNFRNIAADSPSNVMSHGEHDASQSAAPLPWACLLTVFSAEKDLNPQGNARLDLNSNDLEFLHKELQSTLDKRSADFIVLYRQYGRTTTVRESDSSGPVPDAKPDFTRPGRYTFHSPLDLIDAAVSVPDSLFDGSETSGTRTIASPYTGNMRSAELFKLLDFVSVGSNTTITGRINLNESPRPVLRCLPGLTESQIDRIIAIRPAPNGENLNEYRHASWLYTEGIVDLATMKFLYDKVTTGGDVFRGQIVAFAPNRGAWLRVESVVDGTVSPPRQVFYKNLTGYGRGFNDDTLQGKQGDDNAFKEQTL